MRTILCILNISHDWDDVDEEVLSSFPVLMKSGGSLALRE